MDASYRKFFLTGFGLLCLLAAEAAVSADNTAPPRALDPQVQRLLEGTLDLERDLRIAEGELAPVRQRLEIVVAVSAGEHFRLRIVELILDGKPLASHTYSPLEIAAFRNGASQRLYVGNPDLGQHRLTVKYAGRGGAGSVGSATLVFTTGTAAQLIEVALKDRVAPKGSSEAPAEPAVLLNLSNWVLPP